MLSCIQALSTERAVTIVVIADLGYIHPSESCIFTVGRVDPYAVETHIRSLVRFSSGELTFGDPLVNVVFGYFLRTGKELLVVRFTATNGLD